MAGETAFEKVELWLADLATTLTATGQPLDGWVDEFREKMATAPFANNWSQNNGDYGDGVALKWRDQSLWMKPRTIALDAAGKVAL